MDNNNQNNNFSYTYSAREQSEIKKIRDKYAPPSEDKMERLRRLDKSVTRKGTAWSIAIGTIGTIIMVGGISICMVGPYEYFIYGVAVGIVGIAIVSLAYPIYSAIVKAQRKKVAPEILRLTDELMK